MTAKQKANAIKFKKAVAEAKKLRAKNPKLTQPQAVKQAFAILFKKNKVGDYHLNNTEFNETRLPISPRKKTTKRKKTYAVLRDYDGTFKKIKRISGVKTSRKKATAKSYHKDTKSHNVRINVVSGVNFTKNEIEFLQKEGKRSKGYIYRGKILWGSPIVLKETKNGTPIEKFYVDNLDIANEIAKELNKGQKYTKVISKNKIK